MPAPLRPLSTGELLDKTFTVYRQNFGVFFGIAILPQLALYAVLTIMGVSLKGRSAAAAGAAIGAALLYFAGSIIAGAVTQAATTFAVSSVYLDQPTSVRSAYSHAKGRILAVIGVTIMFAIAFGIGSMLLLIPGLLVLMWYSLALPATVIERTGVSASFTRSKQLSQGSGFRVLVVYVLMLILVLAVSVGVGMLIGLAIAPLKESPLLRQTLAQLSNYLVGALLAPFITIALTLLYYDQRVRKEAFDIAHMMTLLPGAETASASATAGLIS